MSRCPKYLATIGGWRRFASFLPAIAREIAEKVKANATIDWTIRESARAKLMVLVRRTLNKYGYPPDKQQKAIDTVLKQAEVLADYVVRVKG
ncbi:MAG: DUF3387 domain-containing protein [Candidatus Brocadia sp.]|nr:MAG: DUF3387 domain-containing protein [Candidatus Brocadia sp.]